MPTAFDASQAVSLLLVFKLNGTVDSMALTSFQQKQQDEAYCTGFVAVPNQQASLLPVSI